MLKIISLILFITILSSCGNDEYKSPYDKNNAPNYSKDLSEKDITSMQEETVACKEYEDTITKYFKDIADTHNQSEKSYYTDGYELQDVFYSIKLKSCLAAVKRMNTDGNEPDTISYRFHSFTDWNENKLIEIIFERDGDNNFLEDATNQRFEERLEMYKTKK